MKKTLSFNFLYAILVVFILGSCGGPSKDIFELVPETAMAVVTVHPGQLMDKGKLQDLTFIEKGASTSELTRRIYENPDESGIDLDKYSAFTMYGTDPTYGSVIMPLKDKVTFEEMLADLAENAGANFEKGSLEEYEKISIEDMLILYDDEKAMALFEMEGWGHDLEAKALEITGLEQEEKLLSDKDFNKFLRKQKDVNAWFTSTNLKGLSEMGDALDLFGGVKNNYGHAFLEFQKGAVLLTTNLRFNQSMQETINKFNFLDQDAIKELLTYMPSEDLVFVGNTNVDPQKIIDLLEFVNQDFKIAFDELTDRLEMEEEDIKEAFSGEVAFALNGIHTFDFGEESNESLREKMPMLTAAVRMKKQVLFKRFLDMAEENNFITAVEGYYTVLNRGIPVYMVLKGSDLIVSNKESIISEIDTEGKIGENVTKTEYSDVLTQRPVCFYLNLDAGSYSEQMQQLMDRRMNERIEMGVNTFGPKLQSLTFSASLEEWEVRLELSDDEENSLYTLLSQLD